MSLNPDNYQIFLPIEAFNYSISLSSSSSNIDGWIKHYGLYCRSQYYVPTDYACSSYDDSLYADAITATPDYSYDSWQIGQYIYFSVGRVPKTNIVATDYSVTATIQSCPSGQIGTAGPFPLCVPYTEIPPSSLDSQTAFSFSGNDGQWVYLVDIPENTSSIQFTLSVPHDAAAYTYALYGRSAGWPYYYYDCYKFSFSSYNNTIANFTINCVNPLAGPFIFLIANDYNDTVLNGSFVGYLTSCSGSYGGINCMYPLQDYVIGDNVTTVIRGYDSSVDNDCSLYYLSTQILPQTEGSWNISCASNASSGVSIRLKSNAYASYSEYDYHILCPGNLNLRTEDFYPGGWKTLALCNTLTVPASVTLTAVGSWGPDQPTTTTTTTTGSQDSSDGWSVTFSAFLIVLLVLVSVQ